MAAKVPVDCTSKDDFDEVVASSPEVAIHFWADWCEPCKHMDEVFAKLCAEGEKATFLRVEAEGVPDISEEMEVEAVPFFVFIKGGKVVGKLEGADPSALVALAQEQLSIVAPGADAGPDPEVAKAELNARIKKTLDTAPVMLFMKGNPEEPRCGFSRKVSGALGEAGVEYKHFDILSDEDIRQGLKEYSSWPTYPQLYVHGELLGGCDVIMELHESGELKSSVEEEATKHKAKVEDRIKAVLASEPVMLFMKGDPSAPRCGFSSKVVAALNETGVPYGHFDILSDNDIRQGLKEYSNWPTYPQLYVKGELLGGCDVILEMHGAGDLKSEVAAGAAAPVGGA